MWLNPHMSWATVAEINLVLRKLGHLTEYAILATLLWRALRDLVRSRSFYPLALIALIACAIFATTDEFHQSFIPSRTASPNDVMIDICGAATGLVICMLFAARRRTGGPEPA
jgi:VanZ family protein